MNSYRIAIPRAAAHKRSLQDGCVAVITSKGEERTVAEFEEICIINIGNMNRALSPYQKARLIEETRKG